MRQNLLTKYFADLWFFLPYLLLYLAWWIFGIDVETLRYVFYGLHIFHLATALYCLKVVFPKKITNIHLINCFSWIIISLLFILPGAFLEYPSDPWEHFRRIFRWQAGGEISNYLFDVKGKFAYFFGWSLLGFLPIELRRVGLDYYSAFWQLLLAVQIYRVFRIGSNSLYAFFAVGLFITTYGTNLFGLRYYALSSTPLAYAAFLQVVIVSLSGNSLRYLFLVLVSSTAMIYFNHKQELLFLAILAPALLWFRLSLSDSTFLLRLQRKGVLVLGGIVALGFLSGPTLSKLFLSADFKPLLGWHGGLPIWSPFYLDTLGVLGWIGIVASIISIIIRPQKVLAWCSLLPVFILLWPPTALLILKSFPSHYLTYRILYAFPAALGIIPFLQIASEKIFNQRAKTLGFAVLSGIVIFIGFNPDAPWRGRLWFATHYGVPEREYNFLLPVVKWFAQSESIQKFRECWITTDDITRTVLVANLGINEEVSGGESSRRGRLLDAKLNTTTLGLSFMTNVEHPFCGILVAPKSQLPAIPDSVIGPRSGHWHSYEGDIHWLIDDKFITAAKGLVNIDWEKTELPLGYLMYTPAKIDSLN